MKKKSPADETKQDSHAGSHGDHGEHDHDHAHAGTNPNCRCDCYCNDAKADTSVGGAGEHGQEHGHDHGHDHHDHGHDHHDHNHGHDKHEEKCHNCNHTPAATKITSSRLPKDTTTSLSSIDTPLLREASAGSPTEVEQLWKNLELSSDGSEVPSFEYLDKDTNGNDSDHYSLLTSSEAVPETLAHDDKSSLLKAFKIIQEINEDYPPQYEHLSRKRYIFT